MSELLLTIVDIVWGLPLIILLIGGGFYLIFVSRLKTLRGFFHAFKLISGKFHHASDKHAHGQLSHFKALTTALSSTVGMGNVGGVAVAITQGGPGAIFWMWVAALVGMNTKFFECTLSTMFRSRDHRGEVQGGPMYVIEMALGKAWKPLAIAFAIFGLMGTLALFNANQVASYVLKHYALAPWLSGLIMASLVGYVLMGGVKRIGEATSKIVPFMCTIYVFACLGIIFMNFSAVPDILISIISEAFTGRAGVGGATGITVMMILRTGVKRAAFSNEAGIGTAPMAHGNAHTEEPIAEGLVAMLGPFIDTILICTMTAIVILLGFPDLNSTGEIEGVLLTQKAFSAHYGIAGTHILGLAVFLFGFSTLIGMANYNQKCWDFLFRGKGIFKSRGFFTLVYCSTIVLGAISSIDDVINFLDIGFALMAVPNMIITIKLAPKVKEAMEAYFTKYLK